MANRKFLLGTLAIALALVMAVSGCSKASKSGGEADGGKGGEPGTLTITGLPEKNYQVLVIPVDKDISSVGKIAFAQTSMEAFDQLPSGRNVFKLSASGGGSWTGKGKRQVILISMDDGEAFVAKNQAMRTATVNFSNGSATVKYSSFTVVTK